MFSDKILSTDNQDFFFFFYFGGRLGSLSSYMFYPLFIYSCFSFRKKKGNLAKINNSLVPGGKEEILRHDCCFLGIFLSISMFYLPFIGTQMFAFFNLLSFGNVRM